MIGWLTLGAEQKVGFFGPHPDPTAGGLTRWVHRNPRGPLPPALWDASRRAWGLPMDNRDKSLLRQPEPVQAYR